MAGLERLIRTMKGQGHPAFIPYITAGDPDLEGTRKLFEYLASAGADIIELGVPFSDPIADGPVNQRAAERSLRSGTTLPAILDFVEELRNEAVGTPVVLFTYFNPLLRMGLEKFARRAKECDVQGVLAVDLPPEEAGEYAAAMRAHGVDTIFLASPTTPPERLKLIDEASTGFVYYVSRMGVTGASAELSATLAEEIARARKHVKKPLAVGFGVSTAEQARVVGELADGVVVGSALVSLLEKHPFEEAAWHIHRLAAEMVAALQPRLGGPLAP